MNKERWYTWRVLTTVEGEDKPRLLVPWSDPHLYEYAFDYLYDSPEEAHDGLETMGAEDDAREEGWILCKMDLEPLPLTKTATLFMVTEDGKRTKLDSSTYSGMTDDQITSLAISNHWDTRLTSASCHPEVEINNDNLEKPPEPEPEPEEIDYARALRRLFVEKFDRNEWDIAQEPDMWSGDYDEGAFLALHHWISADDARDLIQRAADDPNYTDPEDE